MGVVVGICLKCHKCHLKFKRALPSSLCRAGCRACAGIQVSSAFPTNPQAGEMQAASLYAVVAAVQAVDKAVDTHSTRLLHLEGRMSSAEQKLTGCQETTAEMEKQLESKSAALGALREEYRQLQRRLENVENLLRNRNFWILRLPPGSKGETPQVRYMDLLPFQTQNSAPVASQA